MKTELLLGEQRLTLRRYPLQQNEQHQAWDAADEYLLQQLSERELAAGSHILIFNDNFGALAVGAIALGYRVTTVNDSWLSQQSTTANLTENFADKPAVTALSSLDDLPSDISLVLMKLPKSNRLLVWQLCQLSCLAKADVTLIAGAKARDIHTSTLALFEKHLGETRTSLAQKKARLIFCEKNKQLSAMPDLLNEFAVEKFAINLRNYPNVFAAEKLDIAAFLMLQHIPSLPDAKQIIDLGCGNGVLAIQAARKNPEALITAVDESYMAVKSAAINLSNNGIESTRVTCQVNDSLDGFSENSADLILCNPPFHQQHTITDHIAMQMFCDAKRVLTSNGRLIVIGNKHLGYHAKLKQLFAHVRIIAANAKFTVVEARH